MRAVVQPPQFDAGDLIDDVVVVLLAAGTGERLGSGRPKAFVGVAGEVMLAHSLRAFEAHEAVDAIVLVVPEGWLEPSEVLVDDLGCDRVSAIQVGGASRAESLHAGLEAVPARRQTAVLVHDAARPIVPPDVIERVLAPLAEGFDAVVPALPAVDTVKRVDATTGEVAETLPREQIRLAQTPQACRASALHDALERVGDGIAALTDDAAAIEQAGGRVTTVAGDARLRKVTTLADLRDLERSLGVSTPPADLAHDDVEEHAEDLEALDEHDLAGGRDQEWTG